MAPGDGPWAAVAVVLVALYAAAPFTATPSATFWIFWAVGSVPLAVLIADLVTRSRRWHRRSEVR